MKKSVCRPNSCRTPADRRRTIGPPHQFESIPAPSLSETGLAGLTEEPAWFVGSLNGPLAEVSATSATEAEWMLASDLSFTEKVWTGIGEESPVELALAASLVALPQMLSDNGKNRIEHNQRVR